MVQQASARGRPYISLFWRLFVPNALVIVGAGIWRLSALPTAGCPSSAPR